jgi:hypothetical protein
MKPAMIGCFAAGSIMHSHISRFVHDQCLAAMACLQALRFDEQIKSLQQERAWAESLVTGMDLHVCTCVHLVCVLCGNAIGSRCTSEIKSRP